MKALFGSLLCLVLASSQCYALKGGPDYGHGSVNVVGTYAGVLQGLFDPTNPASSNTIGIFTLGVPQTGMATGNFIMFARGRTFDGTIDATADPSKASLKGIVTATYNYTLHVPVTTTDPTTGVVTTTFEDLAVTASVNGPINAQATNLPSTLFTASGTLLSGDATLYISNGAVQNDGDPVINEIVLLNVSGFKQSNTVTTGGG